MDDRNEATSLRNSTSNGTAVRDCSSVPNYFTVLMLMDLLTILMGQPMTAKLLWITLTSKKTKDLLNVNLAFFHSIQYVLFNVHFFVLLFHRDLQEKILRSLYVFVQTGGPMNLTIICLERYIAVIHPTFFPLLKKYRCRKICIVFVWLCSLPVALATLPKDRILSDTIQINVGSLSFVIMIIMVTLMMYSSVTVARALTHSAVGKDVLHPVKKRAFTTIVVVSYTALFCYIPVTLMQQVENSVANRYTCVTTPLSIFFLSAASVVHPAFYLSTQGKLCNCCTREKKHK